MISDEFIYGLDWSYITRVTCFDIAKKSIFHLGYILEASFPPQWFIPWQNVYKDKMVVKSFKGQIELTGPELLSLISQTVSIIDIVLIQEGLDFQQWFI